jgi:hypothetical protein
MKEKTCYRCKESWPADEEFYNRLSDGRLHSYCRACCLERGRELRAGAPRLVRRGPNVRLPWWLTL